MLAKLDGYKTYIGLLIILIGGGLVALELKLGISGTAEPGMALISVGAALAGFGRYVTKGK